MTHAMSHVYFDHNATTPLDERVLAAMLPFLREQYGNASSRHDMGITARRAIDAAREQVAALVNVRPQQVVFTSGGTEANNLFIKGAAEILKPAQVAVSAIEHPCVTEAARKYFPRRHRFIPVTRAGQVDLVSLRKMLRNKPPGLLAVMAANNETGVIQPWRETLELCRERSVPFFCDAVQWIGKRADNPRVRGVIRGVVLSSGGLLLSAAMPLTQDAYTGAYSVMLILASFAVLTFTKIDSAWIMLGAALLGLAPVLLLH